MSRSADRKLSVLSRHAEGRSYDLGRMGPRDLVVAYFTFPTVIVYLVLMAASAALALRLGALNQPWRSGAAAGAAVVIYPAVWYGLHRFLLHGRWLYKHRQTAALWKRIHFDHHQDPHRMDVLFGALWNTVPTIAAATVGIGWMIGGPSAALAAFSAGIGMTLLYEYCHCVQHLNYQPRNAWLKKIKRLHMAHHFHNEDGNFGIISFGIDALFGSLYETAKDKPRSPTVHNLGYDEDQARRYPWVAELTRRQRAKG